MDDSKAVFDKAIAEASVVFNRTKTVYERAKQEAIRDFSRAGSINNAIREAQVKLDGGDSWGTNYHIWDPNVSCWTTVDAIRIEDEYQKTMAEPTAFYEKAFDVFKKAIAEAKAVYEKALAEAEKSKGK